MHEMVYLFNSSITIYTVYISTNVILNQLTLLQAIPFINSQQVVIELFRKYQKNLEKQGITGPQTTTDNRGNVNPSSVGV